MGGSGMDRNQLLRIRIGLGLNNFTARSSLEVARLIGVFLMHFIKKFRVWGLRLGCMFKFRLTVCL